jgi:hypothetical protein
LNGETPKAPDQQSSSSPEQSCLEESGLKRVSDTLCLKKELALILHSGISAMLCLSGRASLDENVCGAFGLDEKKSRSKFILESSHRTRD